MIPVRARTGLHRVALAAAAACSAAALVGCSSLENTLAGDKVDYRQSGKKGPGLDVPPDLTQLARDTRFQQAGGAVSAATYQSAAASPAAVPTSATPVAPAALGELRLERDGATRWLVVPMPPEQLWPQLQAFWKDNGFALVLDQPATGTMETEWAENRAKLPNDFIRNTLGKLIDGLYSTGERDKFRTRVERNAAGASEVFISHRGMIEVYTNNTTREATAWQPRPSDPQLEAEFLSRLLVKLGMKEEAAKTTLTAATAAPQAPARARLLPGSTTALQVDDGFDRAWRRVGLALDRGGFTVEDRDRAQGVYFVRFVEAGSGGSGGGFFSRLFGGKDEAGAPARYRVSVKAEGERSTVSVLDAQGAPSTGAAAQRIATLLVDDLK